MHKKVLAASIAILLVSSSKTNAALFANAVGFGSQYGGIVGWQGSIISGANKYRFGLGRTGLAFGYDRFIWSNTSLGAQYFVNQFVAGFAVNVNYHFSDQIKGWVVGLDLYSGLDPAEATFEVLTGLFDFDDTLDDIDLEDTLESGAFVSIGFHF